MQGPVTPQVWDLEIARIAHNSQVPMPWRHNDRHVVVVSLVCALLATLSLGLSVWIRQQHPEGLPTSAAYWAAVVSGALVALLLVAGGLGLAAIRAVPEATARPTEVPATAFDKDRLTGLLNRRAFMAFAEDAIAYYQRYHRGFAVLMVEVDDLAAVDRARGSAVDDLVLGHVADVLDLSLRKTDKICRFDRERFAILLREISQPDAMALSERMRKSVESLSVHCGERSIPVTVSIGVALASRADVTIGMLMSRADIALTKAQCTGTNSVSWQPVPDGGATEPRATMVLSA